MRKDIMSDPAALADYVDGVWALKRTPADDPRYSRYDWYVLWHAVTMMTMTPDPNSNRRNAAHSWPAFLPWHRYYLKPRGRNRPGAGQTPICATVLELACRRPACPERPN